MTIVLDSSALLLFPDHEPLGQAVGAVRATGGRVLLPVVALAVARDAHWAPELLNLLSADRAAEVVPVGAEQSRALAAMLAFTGHDVAAAHAALVALTASAPVLTGRPSLYAGLPVTVQPIT